MSVLGWFVYSGAIVSVVIVLGLLLWTLQVRMDREMHGEVVATYHQAHPRVGDPRTEPTQRTDPKSTFSNHPLPAAERARFAKNWRSLQPMFVNDPDDAVKEADRLITDLMRMTGYPTEESEQAAVDASMDQPDVLSHYRDAHRLARRAAKGQATIDEERHALVEYREVFNTLLGDGQPDASQAQSIPQTG